MELLAWLFVGVLATVFTLITMGMWFDEVLGGTISTILWVVFALGATSVTITTDTAMRTDSYTALAFFGVGMAGLMIIVTLKGVVFVLDVVGARSPTTREL